MGPLRVFSPLQEQRLSAGSLLPKTIIKTWRGSGLEKANLLTLIFIRAHFAICCCPHRQCGAAEEQVSRESC